jgi:predicted ATPase/class 3 adenylate cyclase
VAELPSGTVTFLLTDIESSTRLWEEHPDQMSEAVARHDGLAAAIIGQHGGTLVKSRGEGDSLFAVFARALEAVTAAGDLQRALQTEAWPEGTPLRVRMAVHTGDAALRGGDYFGAAINRCARLRAAAHGGQVVLSGATHGLVQDNLPEDVSLKDLGPHCLKDLQRPQNVFQIVRHDLPSDFPPLKSLDALPTNLPAQLTRFIGREREMDRVKRLLVDTRLLTLTGAGGVGKTRLALQVAADVLEEYPEGVWLVELAALPDPALVPQDVAAAVRVREEPNRSLVDTLSNALRRRRMLLVLDNCEHLLEACAPLALTLLRQCPDLQVLATSREPLGISGETIWRVPSLEAPAPMAREAVEEVTQYEAVRLFIDRAREVRPGFTVTNDTAPAVAQICHRLDGIPLAIELAAARVRALSVKQLMARLDDRFRLLSGGSRTALPRQQTLRAAIDWSYDLLSEPERTLLRRLSVFAGGWTLEAAEAVCEGDPVEGWQVLDVLTRLVEKSLVVYEEDEQGNGRYRLLETVRQYGRERLLEGGEADWLRSRHGHFFARRAEEGEAELVRAGQVAMVGRLAVEHENLRAALEWAIHTDTQAALRMGGSLWRFWKIRGHQREGREWLRRALAAPGAEPSTAARAMALHGLAWLTNYLGSLDEACSAREESVAIWRQLGNEKRLAEAINGLGHDFNALGDPRRAAVLIEDGLRLCRQIGDKTGTGRALSGLGFLARVARDYPRADALLAESLYLHRELGHRQQTSFALTHLGLSALEQGRPREGIELLEQSLDHARELEDGHQMAEVLSLLGAWHTRLGNHQAAAALLEECLVLNRQHGLAREPGEMRLLGYALYRGGGYQRARGLLREALVLSSQHRDEASVAATLKYLGLVLAAEEQGREGAAARAVRLIGAAEALRAALNFPVLGAEAADYGRGIASLRSALDPETFAAAWAEGQAMTLEQAVAHALEEGEAGDLRADRGGG